MFDAQGAKSVPVELSDSPAVDLIIRRRDDLAVATVVGVVASLLPSRLFRAILDEICWSSACP